MRNHVTRQRNLTKADSEHCPKISNIILCYNMGGPTSPPFLRVRSAYPHPGYAGSLWEAVAPHLCPFPETATVLFRDYPTRCGTVYAMSWPTTDDPRTEFVTLRLTVAEADALDTYARSKHLTRSAAVRDSVIRVINAEAKRSAKTKTNRSDRT